MDLLLEDAAAVEARRGAGVPEYMAGLDVFGVPRPPAPRRSGRRRAGPQRGAAPHRRRRRRLPPDRRPGPEGSIGKLAMAELEQRVRELHLDLLGPAGMLYTTYEMTRPECSVSDSPHRSFLRSRATTIEGGTSEVMRDILGERVLGLPPEPRRDRDLPWVDVPRF